MRRGGAKYNSSMVPNGTLENLARHTHDLLRSLSVPTLAPFLADWPDHADSRAGAPSPEGSKAMPPAVLPVLHWMTDIAGDECSFGVSVVADLCRNATSLAWRQTYTTAEVTDEFLRNYGWTEILGSAAPRAAARIACGFLLLGPATLYPRHRHEAEEIYVPLSGTARWQQGDAIWRERPPGSVIHHASDEPHAMLTGARPLLALYVWRSEHLNQTARLDSASGN
jgi:hypothetical protein